MATEATTETMIQAIDPAELSRLYRLASRDSEAFAVQVAGMFGLRGIAAVQAEYVAHAHGVTAYLRDGTIRRALRSDLYPYAGHVS